MAFLEYGTPQRTPRAVELAREQVRAAVLADVEGLPHLEIANRLDLNIPGRSYDIYAKIPAVTRLIEAGRTILEGALPDTGWPRYAEQMKVEAERYSSLSDEEKEVEALAAGMGWALGDARDLYRTNLGLARFLATPLHP